MFVCDRVADNADSKHQLSSANDSTCVAARTRPLVSCRRRRLIQPNTVSNLNGKVRSPLVKHEQRCSSLSFKFLVSGASDFMLRKQEMHAGGVGTFKKKKKEEEDANYSRNGTLPVLT